MGTQHWTADEDRLLGTMTDRDAANASGDHGERSTSAAANCASRHFALTHISGIGRTMNCWAPCRTKVGAAAEAKRPERGGPPA